MAMEINKRLLQIQFTRNAAGVKMTVRGDAEALTIIRGTSIQNFGGQRIPTGKYAKLEGLSAVFAGANLFSDYDENVNLAPILDPRISEGISYQLEGPISKDKLRDYFDACKRELANLYRNYLAPVDMTIDISATCKENLPNA